MKASLLSLLLAIIATLSIIAGTVPIYGHQLLLLDPVQFGEDEGDSAGPIVRRSNIRLSQPDLNYPIMMSNPGNSPLSRQKRKANPIAMPHPEAWAEANPLAYPMPMPDPAPVPQPLKSNFYKIPMGRIVYYGRDEFDQLDNTRLFPVPYYKR